MWSGGHRESWGVPGTLASSCLTAPTFGKCWPPLPRILLPKSHATSFHWQNIILQTFRERRFYEIPSCWREPRCPFGTATLFPDLVIRSVQLFCLMQKGHWGKSVRTFFWLGHIVQNYFGFTLFIKNIKSDICCDILHLFSKEKEMRGPHAGGRKEPCILSLWEDSKGTGRVAAALTTRRTPSFCGPWIPHLCRGLSVPRGPLLSPSQHLFSRTHLTCFQPKQLQRADPTSSQPHVTTRGCSDGLKDETVTPARPKAF